MHVGRAVFQAVGPEVQRTRRDGEQHLARLVGAAAAVDPDLPEGERGEHGARVAVGVAVVEVVDRDLAVEQHGPLDQAEAEDVHVEVDVLLRAGHRHGDVVATVEVRHSGLLFCGVHVFRPPVLHGPGQPLYELAGVQQQFFAPRRGGELDADGESGGVETAADDEGG
ncbi:hypothetical protein AB0383_18985 [Amycolatopsis sp. NPDC051373]|uniref:hypothetical protein n=1 Tax=Amycolatopsis sp. NPDC051373 TaxID=3155801 RepID=UPI00344C1CC1